MIRNLWAFCTIPLFFVGCTSTDSTLVETGDIYADFVAVATATETEVEATLRIGGASSSNFVDLEGGDVLRATFIHATSGAETTETMQEREAFGITWYTAEFSTQEEDTGFRIDFDRDTETSAPESTVTLPAPFTLATDTGTTTFYRAAGSALLYLEWTPFVFASGDVLSYEVAGSCIETYQGNINWDAPDYYDSLQLANGTLSDAAPPNDGQDCTVTATITLTRTGTVDRAFGEGGVFLGTQVRTIDLQSRSGTP